MTVFYLDSSAWVKFYVAETGSRWVGQFWDLKPPCACSQLGLVEIIATLTRRNRQKPASSGSYDQAIVDVEQQFRAINSIPIDNMVVARACQIARARALRGADSVHLASALRFREALGVPVTLIASDAELLVAASAEGFPTLDPVNDPALPIVS